MPEIVNRNNCMIFYFEFCFGNPSWFTVLQIQIILEVLNPILLSIDLLKSDSGSIGPTNQINNYSFISSLVRNKLNGLLESTFLFRWKIHVKGVTCPFSNSYLCRNHFKIAYLIFLCIFSSFYFVHCFSSSILYVYFFTVPISNPTMSTIDFRRPFSLAFLPLSEYWNFNNSISRYYDNLILIIMEVDWSKPDEYWNRHARSNIARVFLWVLDRGNDELFGSKRSNFDPLDVFCFVN